MSIRVDWFEPEKKNICYFIDGSYTWEELFHAIQEATTLLDSVNYRVNILIDMLRSQHIPPLSPVNLRKLASAPTMTHENTGVLVIIGAKVYIHAMFDIFKRIYPRAAEKYQFVRTMEELRVLLEHFEQAG